MHTHIYIGICVYMYTHIYYVMLCYVMLCYVMLCYVMLCYVMLCYNIIILWDHRRICGPSLTETSLCFAWLYFYIRTSQDASLPECDAVSLGQLSPTFRRLALPPSFLTPDLEERATTTILRNAGNYVSKDTASYPIRLESSATPLW